MDRPSPSESATLFDIGTKKIGNDGKLWIIIKTSNGTKRWSKYTEFFFKINNNEVIEFKLNKIKNIKEHGIFQVDSFPVIGELNYSPLNGFKMFRKGSYYIYTVDDNFLLCKEQLNKKNY